MVRYSGGRDGFILRYDNIRVNESRFRGIDSLEDWEDDSEDLRVC